MWRRADLCVQAALCLGFAAWCLVCACRWLPGMDECWHVWFGEIESWRLFRREISYDTHPPALSLLLQAISAPGDSFLWARSTAMIPAVATVPLFYVLCRQVGLCAPLAHVGTAVFAFSHSFVSIAVCTRSYALANLFVIAALSAMVALAQHPRQASRGAVWQAVLGTLAAAGCLYASLLPTLLALAFVVRGWHAARRQKQIERCPVVRAPLVVLALGLVALLAFYCLTCHVPVHTFIGQFVRSQGTDVWAYLLAGFNQNVANFTPFQPALASWLSLVVTSAAWLALLAIERRRAAPERVMILLLLPVLAILMGLLGSVQQYPWGGNSRHQFVLFVPLVLSTLFALDFAYRRAPTGAWRVGIVTVFAGAAVAGTLRSYAGPHLDDFRRTPIWAADYAALTQVVKTGDVVHVHRYAQIGLYARARDEGGWRWLGTLKGDGVHVDRFAARIGDQAVTVLLDHSSYCLPHQEDLAWGQRTTAALAATETRSAWIFGQTPFAEPAASPSAPGLGARAARSLAAGLHVAAVIEFASGALLRVERP